MLMRLNSCALTTGLCLLTLLAGTAVAAPTHPGPVGNVGIGNPYGETGDGGFGSGIAVGDFDDDGIADLAIASDASYHMRILRGTSWQVGHITAIKFFGKTVDSEYHGSPTASGDFDGDGRDEIAVGAYFSPVDGLVNAGLVYVFDRASNGVWSVQGTIRAGDNYPGAAQEYAHFGSSLAAGDFNGDGFDDLAIGIVDQGIGSAANAGAVMIVYGTSHGLGPTGATIFDRHNDGLTFVPTVGDAFGFALAARDFNNDGLDDLAIGIPKATCPDGVNRGGGVVVMQGHSGTGLDNTQSHIWRPGAYGVAGTCANLIGFGKALASGNTGKSNSGIMTFPNLAIGAPGSDGGRGVVHMLYGTASGLDVAGNQRITAPYLPDDGSELGHFGEALAIGDLAHECIVLSCHPSSLVVGAPGTRRGGFMNAGAVWIFDSDFFTGLDLAHPRSIIANPSLKVSAPSVSSQFGKTLAIGDFNDDGLADLAIGVPGYPIGAGSGNGAVEVLYQSDYLFVGTFDIQSP